MRIRLPLGLAGLALTLPVAAAVAEQPAAPSHPARPERVIQLWQTSDTRFGGGADAGIFQDAVAGSRPVATTGRRNAAGSSTGAATAAADESNVGDSNNHTGTKVAVGTAGALGLLFFIDAVTGGNDNSSLTPIDQPGGTGGNGGNVTPPGGGSTGGVVDNSNPGGTTGGNVNTPPNTIVIDQQTPETTTPEPVSMTLMGTGLVGLGGMSLRRRRRNS
jgi:hypothetical protein